MPEDISVLRPVSAVPPDTKDRSRTPSASDPPPAQKLVEGPVGFIGLGRMGTAMATNLAHSGCKVIGFVRRPERSK